MSELKLRDDILDELAYEPIVDTAHIGVAVDQDKASFATGMRNLRSRMPHGRPPASKMSRTS
jgi:hypothetical protein